MKAFLGGGGGGACVKVVSTGPNPKGEGLTTGRSCGRDADGGWSNVIVIGPKAKGGGVTGGKAGTG